MKKEGWGTYCLLEANVKEETAIPVPKVAIRPLEVPVPTLYVPSDTYYSPIVGPGREEYVEASDRQVLCKSLRALPR